MNRRMILPVLLAALLPAAAAQESRDGNRIEIPREMVEGDWMFTLGPYDIIPAIDAPVFVSRQEAEAFMDDGEPVLGLVVNGEARAYSLYHLDHHEIVNDTVGGRAVAVTW